MPVYTYHCDCCDHEFDKKQAFSDPNLTQCPNCEEGCLRRVYKPARVVFKGSGFYVTDNKSSTRPVRHTGSEETKSENKEKEDSKLESKTEKKTEKKKEKPDKKSDKKD